MFELTTPELALICATLDNSDRQFPTVFFDDLRRKCHAELSVRRRNEPDYPRDKWDAQDVLINWPPSFPTERQVIAAQQLLRTPPALEGTDG